MIRFFRRLYLTNRLFYALGGTAFLFATSFFLPFLFPVAQAILAVISAIFFVDVFLLFNPSLKIAGKRTLQKIFSLGDENNIAIDLENSYALPLHIRLIDELPEQFQRRDFSFQFLLKGKEKRKITYPLRPLTRGIYEFGDINLLLSSVIGFCRRRWTIPLLLQWRCILRWCK
jgi:uncharacterized protein (DUF58 family)